MKASDFILQTRADLQEKSEHWKDEELLMKLQRSYVSLQFDLPYFITSETIAITEGKSEYYLLNEPLKNVSFSIDSTAFNFSTIDNFYISLKDKQYTFNTNRVIINHIPIKNSIGIIVYKFNKKLVTTNCEVELPAIYLKALRLLFMSDIHEKPTRNTKERNLSVHYIKLYEQEIRKLKIDQKLRPTNLTSNYQRI
jgi:hypothetical protein